MTDRDAMLRAIAANPDDDTPRLIYADLLDELGGDANAARARFIRLQIETHRGPGETDFALFNRKLAEIDMLGVRYGQQWLSELPAGVSATSPSSVTSHAFKRGFVEDATLDFAKYTDCGFEFLTRNPINTIRARVGKPDQLTALLDHSALAHIRALHYFGCDLRDLHLHEIACCPNLGNLWQLDLGTCLVSDRGLSALARAESLSNLGVLQFDCRGKGLTDTGIIALLTSTQLPKLRELDLGYRRKPFVGRTNLQARFPNVRIRY